MWPPTAPCFEKLASWEHVIGQWCSKITEEEMRPLHGMYGSVEAELEVQRTIKRAELTAFFCLLKRVFWTSTAWQNNGRTVKSSSPSRKKSGFSWTRRVRKRSIEQSGVRKQTSIYV